MARSEEGFLLSMKMSGSHHSDGRRAVRKKEDGVLNAGYVMWARLYWLLEYSMDPAAEEVEPFLYAIQGDGNR